MDRRPFICPIVASGAHGSGTMHAIGASGPGRGGMTKGCRHLVADFYPPRPSSGDSPYPEPLLPSPYLADPQTNTENTEDGSHDRPGSSGGGLARGTNTASRTLPDLPTWA